MSKNDWERKHPGGRERGQGRQDRAAEKEAARQRQEAAARDRRERDAETERRRQERMKGW
jgi:hypothetical protein